jgi:succinoglycan biosynthesis transport protein ExoP
LQDQAQAAFGEITRLAEQYAGEEAAARSREAALRASVATATATNDSASALQVQLRALEQRAQAVTALYQSFLTRFEAIDQQKSFPVSNIRLLSAADAPRAASGPSTVKTLVLAMVLGLMAGAGFGALREFRDRVFRTGAEVSAETGLPFLGYLPDLSRYGQVTALERMLKGRSDDTQVHSAKHPKSQYSETLRAIRMATEAGLPADRRPVLGIASALPGEGKTTLALNLAALIAASGRTVLLIDADLRNPGLTRLTNARKGPGLVEALIGRASLQDAKFELGGRLHVVPSLSSTQIAHTSDLLASSAMGKLLDEARRSYDYVIVDLPPIGPVIDTRAILRHLNRLVLLAEWGRTPKGLMRQLLADDPALADMAVGVVLNRVDIDALDRYGPTAGAERFKGAYAGYYTAS